MATRNPLLLPSLVWCLTLLAVMLAALFLPAGMLHYWQGWAYLAAFFLPSVAIAVWLYRRDPDLLKARLSAKEARPAQKILGHAAWLLFGGIWLVSAFDYRFGWVPVPAIFSAVSALAIVAAMGFVAWVFRVNTWLGGTVEIRAGQKVISHGPYALVRHPMYLGIAMTALLSPPALGSCYGLLLVPPWLWVITLRLLDEENCLKMALAGYETYCLKVRYRLLPFVW